MTLSTHVLDATAGARQRTWLSRCTAGPRLVGSRSARASPTTTAGAAPWHRAGLQAAIYRLVFDTGAYFVASGQQGFYPEVSIVFEVTEPTRHYHVPLLLSPFAYSTYRGS